MYIYIYIYICVCVCVCVCVYIYIERERERGWEKEREMCVRACVCVERERERDRERGREMCLCLHVWKYVCVCVRRSNLLLQRAFHWHKQGPCLGIVPPSIVVKWGGWFFVLSFVVLFLSYVLWCCSRRVFMYVTCCSSYRTRAAASPSIVVKWGGWFFVWSFVVVFVSCVVCCCSCRVSVCATCYLAYARYSFTFFCVHECIIHVFLPPIRITHTTATLVCDFCATYDPPPDPLLICHTLYNIGNGNIVWRLTWANLFLFLQDASCRRYWCPTWLRARARLRRLLGTCPILYLRTYICT